jgi:hypothetical protein
MKVFPANESNGSVSQKNSCRDMSAEFQRKQRKNKNLESLRPRATLLSVCEAKMRIYPNEPSISLRRILSSLKIMAVAPQTA